MCELCLTNPVFYALTPDRDIETDVIPGWSLIKARTTGELISSGQWALVNQGRPDIIWWHQPVTDPLFRANTDDIEAAPEHIDERFHAGAFAFQQLLKVSPEIGDRLIAAGKVAGYREKEDTNFAFWLFHHLAKWLETHSPVPCESLPEPHPKETARTTSQRDLR